MTEPTVTPWQDEEHRDRNIPTMLTREELRYLHWLTRTQWTGAGCVLEIGPWLGGSSWCLADGLRASDSARDARLHIVDNFAWRPFMASRAPLDLDYGESFLAHTLANLAEFGELVAVQQASLPDEAIPGDAGAAAYRDAEEGSCELFHWSADQPVEILFVDGAKSWKGLRHLLLAVNAALVPGRSLLVFQDYEYWEAYWVPAIVERLSASLELLHVVDHGDTVTFRLREPIPDEEIRGVPEDVSVALPGRVLDDLDRAGKRLTGIGSEAGAHKLALSKVAFLAHRGDLDGACAAFERAQSAWPLGAATNPLDRARRYLADTWSRAPRERRALAIAQRAKSALARFGR